MASGFSQRTCLPARKHCGGLLVVEAVGRRDVDRIDFAVAEHFVERLVRLGNAEPLGGLARSIGRAAKYADDALAGPAEGLDVDRSDKAGAEYGDVKYVVQGSKFKVQSWRVTSALMYRTQCCIWRLGLLLQEEPQHKQEDRQACDPEDEVSCAAAVGPVLVDLFHWH